MTALREGEDEINPALLAEGFGHHLTFCLIDYSTSDEDGGGYSDGNRCLPESKVK
jgi:hypothetical protein